MEILNHYLTCLVSETIEHRLATAPRSLRLSATTAVVRTNFSSPTREIPNG